MPELTLIVTTFNEEKNIGQCLEMAGWADQIIVVDSFSTDRTPEIVRAFPKVELFQREYKYPADQKNWAIEKARGEWILILDADEVLTPHLSEEIRRTVNSETPVCGFFIKRAGYFLGHRIRFSGWQNDKVMRLFKRGRGRYSEETYLHEKMIIGGPAGTLSGNMLHYSFHSIDQYLEKMRRYADYAARDKMEKGRASNPFIMILRFKLKFFKSYFLQLGILDGFWGFYLCLLSAFAEMLKWLKLYLLRRDAGSGRKN